MSTINQDYFQNIKQGIDCLSKSKAFDKHVSYIASKIVSNSDSNKFVVIYGNGGSAADAQHFSAELVGTYKNKKRRSFKSIALNTDTSFLTAWSNDFDFKSVFERQIEAFGINIGMSIGLSTSGKSLNILNGLKKSKLLGIETFLISGKNCPEYDYVDHVIRLPSDDTSIIQTYTQIMYHLICIQLEQLE